MGTTASAPGAPAIHVRAGQWVWSRAREVSTWIGAAITAVGSASFPPTGVIMIDHYTPLVQHCCQFAGVALACMSTRHP